MKLRCDAAILLTIVGLCGRAGALDQTAVTSPWHYQDIGAVTVAGGASVADGVITLKGTLDIWGTNDQFNYVNQPVTGDGNATLIARVTSQTNTSSNAKAGIIFKQSTTARAID